jgi:hypothetical protein
MPERLTWATVLRGQRFIPDYFYSQRRESPFHYDSIEEHCKELWERVEAVDYVFVNRLNTYRRWFLTLKHRVLIVHAVESGIIAEYPPFMPPAWRGPLWDPESRKHVKARDYVNRVWLELCHEDMSRGDFWLADWLGDA